MLVAVEPMPVLAVLFLVMVDCILPEKGGTTLVVFELCEFSVVVTSLVMGHVRQAQQPHAVLVADVRVGTLALSRGFFFLPRCRRSGPSEGLQYSLRDWLTYGVLHPVGGCRRCKCSSLEGAVMHLWTDHRDPVSHPHHLPSPCHIILWPHHRKIPALLNGGPALPPDDLPPPLHATSSLDTSLTFPFPLLLIPVDHLCLLL